MFRFKTSCYFLLCIIIVAVMSLADAKTARKTCKTKVTKLGNKISNLIIEGDRLAEVTQLIAQIKSAFSDFSKSHESVVALDPDNEIVHDSYFDNVESNYYKILSRAKEANVSETSAFKSSDSTVVGLLSLPKLELEIFTGEALKYPTFIKSFKASVETCSSDPDIRLTRLYQFLGGEAREAVRSSLFIGGSQGYSSALDTLEKLYGSKHRIAQDIIKSLRSPKPAKSCKDLRQLASDVRGAYQVLSSINSLSEKNF